MCTFSDVGVLVAIAKFDSFVDTGGGSRGNCGAEASYVRNCQGVKSTSCNCGSNFTFCGVKVNFDGGVAPRVEDLIIK